VFEPYRKLHPAPSHAPPKPCYIDPNIHGDPDYGQPCTPDSSPPPEEINSPRKMIFDLAVRKIFFEEEETTTRLEKNELYQVWVPKGGYQMRAIPVGLRDDEGIHNAWWDDDGFVNRTYPGAAYKSVFKGVYIDIPFWNGVHALVHGKWLSAVRHFDESLAAFPSDLRARYYRLLAMHMCHMHDQVNRESREINRFRDSHAGVHNPLIVVPEGRLDPGCVIPPPGHRTWEVFHHCLRQQMLRRFKRRTKQAILEAEMPLLSSQYLNWTKACIGPGAYPPPEGTPFDLELKKAATARLPAMIGILRQRHADAACYPPEWDWESEARHKIFEEEERRLARQDFLEPQGYDNRGRVIEEPAKGSSERRMHTTPSGRLILPYPTRTVEDIRALREEELEEKDRMAEEREKASNEKGKHIKATQAAARRLEGMSGIIPTEEIQEVETKYKAPDINEAFPGEDPRQYVRK